MTGDNLTELQLGPQAQRTEQASNLRGLGIPEMEANRSSRKTILIILVGVLLLGGGGFNFGRRR